MHRIKWPAGRGSARARAATPMVRLVLVVVVAGCASGPGGWKQAEPVTTTPTPYPISLRADALGYTWIDRTAGTVNRYDPKTVEAGVVASVQAATDGEQRGLLGYTVMGTRSFVAFTRKADRRLIVAELGAPGSDGVARPARTIWSGTTTATKAIGGHLEARDGLLILGLGELDGWAKAHGSGAIVTLDPDGPERQEPRVLSDGWHNPFAFAVTKSGDVWVADNAPDGGIERIGRGDVRRAATGLSLPQRAPSALIELADGRLAVCGLLDGEVRAYRIDTGESGRSADSRALGSDGGFAGVERAGTVAEGCATGLALDAEGALLIAGPLGISRAGRK